MLDLDREEYIPLRTAAKLVPSSRKPGRPVHISTLVRWSTKGVRGNRLETFLIGDRRFTSRSALQRFLASLNQGADLPRIVVGRDPVRDQRTRRILEDAGLPRPRTSCDPDGD